MTGCILPGALYTKEGCMIAAGLGENSLVKARDSGLVLPVKLGKRLFYKGSDLIRWIESQNVEPVAP